jgi:hypothetical protein
VLHLAISSNRPKFCANATWNTTATTFADVNIIGSTPYGMFINTNNTVYVANRLDGRIVMWREGVVTPVRNFSGNLSTPYGIFVTDSEDIYVDNGATLNNVLRWSLNATIGVPAMYVCDTCYGVFVDVMNNLYCAMVFKHQVVSTSLERRMNFWNTVAGTGVVGTTANTLYRPSGLYVDQNLDLYVADCGNDRVQRFRSGQLNGTTVAGVTAPGTLTLNCPTGVNLDADGYMFIVDCYNHRVVRSGPNGFICLFGCGGSAGTSATQLYYPVTLSFDTYGNIFIVDHYNYRIQRFTLLFNGCGSKYCFTSFDE